MFEEVLSIVEAVGSLYCQVQDRDGTVLLNNFQHYQPSTVGHAVREHEESLSVSLGLVERKCDLESLKCIDFAKCGVREHFPGGASCKEPTCLMKEVRV